MMKNARSFDVFCGCTGMGIDVSKATLEVAGLAGSDVWRTTMTNTRTAIETLAMTLSEGGYSGKIICESTGHYHFVSLSGS